MVRVAVKRLHRALAVAPANPAATRATCPAAPAAACTSAPAPKLKRTVARAASAVNPIAVSAGEGRALRDEQAEPIDAATPARSRPSTSARPSTPTNET